jgi:hypothetical protein
MCVVERVKLLFFISNVRMFFLIFFSSHSNAPPYSDACTSLKNNETSREMRWQRKNDKKSRKIMPYIASPVWIYDHAWMFLILSFSSSIADIVNIVKSGLKWNSEELEINIFWCDYRNMCAISFLRLEDFIYPNNEINEMIIHL